MYNYIPLEGEFIAITFGLCGTIIISISMWQVNKYTSTFYSHLVEQQNLERKAEAMVKVLLEV